MNPFVMVADLCHVVWACFQGENAKIDHAKKCHISHIACFCMTNLLPSYAKPWQIYGKKHNIIHVTSLPSVCHAFAFLTCQAKKEKSKITVFWLGQVKWRKVATRTHTKTTVWQVFVWRPFVLLRETITDVWHNTPYFSVVFLPSIYHDFTWLSDRLPQKNTPKFYFGALSCGAI